VRSKFGDDGAGAAFLIAQHAIGLPAFQRRVLALLLEGAEAGEVNVVDTAYLSDRIAVFEERPQLFGTQFDWDEQGQLSPVRILDPDDVDARRASVGLPALGEVIADMRARVQAEGQGPPTDLAKRRADFESWARRVGWRT
jgi:hypothetical protein